MSLELVHCVAVLAVVREELEDHVLEVRGEAGAVHLLEVGFNLTGQEQVVEVLFFAGLFEGENALDDDEDNYTDGEQIHLGAVVGFAFLDLGCHVGHGATVGLELVDAFVASKAEVSDLQVELFINENVLELKVAMYASEVVHVVKGSNHLGHKEATGILAHGAHGLTQVKEEASRNLLHDDEDEVVNDAT